MDLGLAGRVYVLTGASRGLGLRHRAMPRRRRRARRHRRSRPGTGRRRRSRLARHHAGPGTATGIALHNADPTTPGQLIGAALEKHGRLDGGLISVGGPPPGTAAGTSDEQWRESFETVFLGALRLARALAHRLAGPMRAQI